MKRLIAVALPVALITVGLAGMAEARRGGKHGGRIVMKLVKKGVLTDADVARLKELKGKAKECRMQVKSGAQAKGSCRAAFLEVLQEKLNVLKAAVDKVKDKPGLSAKVAKTIQKLEKRIAKKQAKAAAPSPQ
jgi:hypothetical protein